MLNENKFSFSIVDLLYDLNSRPISQKQIVDEIKLMRTNTKSNKNNEDINNPVNNERSKWFETKYVGGGQREIEYLNFFYKINSNFKLNKDTEQTSLVNKMCSVGIL